MESMHKHRDLAIIFLHRYVWTFLKEWNIYHCSIVFIVTLLPEMLVSIFDKLYIAAAYIITYRLDKNMMAKVADFGLL